MQKSTLPLDARQFLQSILNSWVGYGGGISGDMVQNIYLTPPLGQISQFTDRNKWPYPHIHVIIQGNACRFVASCNMDDHGSGSDISPNEVNPDTRRYSTPEEFVTFFMTRLKQCQSINDSKGVGASASAPAPAPASAFVPSSVKRNMMKNAAKKAQADQGGKHRIIKKTQRRLRGNRSRTKRNKFK